MKFRIRQLEAFRAVAQAGSVTRAAQELKVSQPAVSRLLSDFTKALGFDPFVRKGGRLLPTNEARYLLGEVNRVFDGLWHLEELSRDLSERTAGHLRIACLPGFATSHLPGMLAEFLRERSGVTVTIEPDRPERILEWIVGEQFDCGITDGFSGHPATESIDVTIRTACILPEGHRLCGREVVWPKDLEQEKLIHTRRDSPFFKRMETAFAEDGAHLNSWIEVRQFTAACSIVCAGQGVSVVSLLDAEQYRDRGLVIKPFAPEIGHRVTVLRPMAGNRSLLALDFLEAFLDSLRPYAENGVVPQNLTL